MGEEQSPKKKRGQGIVRLGSLFEKYQKTLRAPQGVVVDTCIEIIAEDFNITLTKTQCAYKTNTKTLSFNVPGVLKTELLLKKQHILHRLKDRLGAQNAPKEIM